MIESWRQLTDFWFLHAYVFMMMLAPIINTAIDYTFAQEDKIVRKKILLSWFVPLVHLCFGWSFVKFVVYCHPSIGWIIPDTPGLGAYTGLTLLGVYAIGRVFRLTRDEIHLPRWMMCAAVLISLFAVAFHFGCYNSPFAVVLAIAGFIVCEMIRLPNWLSRVVIFVAPSMFSVYLLQTNRFFIPKFEFIINAMPDVTTPVRYLQTASFVLAICVATDLVRRILANLLEKMIKYKSV